MGGPASDRGPGSGHHNGPRGRRPGGHNSAEGCAAIRVGMLAAHEIKRHRPGVCDECKRPPDGRDSLEWFQRRWLCGSCLADEMEPLRIEDFVYSGTSCLGAAICESGMESGHGHGPTGDARPHGGLAEALSTDATRAARRRRSA